MKNKLKSPICSVTKFEATNATLVNSSFELIFMQDSSYNSIVDAIDNYNFRALTKTDNKN